MVRQCDPRFHGAGELSRHEAVQRAFGAASAYDDNARVQRIAAEKLAARIAALPLPASPRVLEIGCGTGFLTQALLDHGIGGEWLITDLAPEMLARCRDRIGDAPGRRFAVLDGEYDAPPDLSYDLVCSSLAMQWFDDQPAAIARMLGWLAPGRHCLFTTLGENTFSEWRTAHAAEGLGPGTPRFASVDVLASILPEAQVTPPQAEMLIDQHGDARQFLGALRAIGATTAAPRHRPLSAAELRRVMRRFEQGGSQISYEVVTCHFTRAT